MTIPLFAYRNVIIVPRVVGRKQNNLTILQKQFHFGYKCGLCWINNKRGLQVVLCVLFFSRLEQNHSTWNFPQFPYAEHFVSLLYRKTFLPSSAKWNVYVHWLLTESTNSLWNEFRVILFKGTQVHLYTLS